MVVLGLSNMRDAAAALVRDGAVVAAAEEERFCRIKHVTALPVRSIRYCLEEGRVTPEDLDGVAVPWKPWVLGRRAGLALGAMLRSFRLARVKGRRSLERLGQEWWELAQLRPRLRGAIAGPWPAPTFLDHHLCHAASAFFPSPFDHAAVLVVDGASESHTTLLADGTATTLRSFHRTPLPHSLGQFYAAFTSFLGFTADRDEYIVMGLAASGEPTYAARLRDQILRVQPDGDFRLNTRLLDFHLARAGLFDEKLTALFGPARRRDEAITQRHRDLAASVQLVLEEALLHLGRRLRRLSTARALCLAGGVAFNCVANRRLQRELEFDKIFVQPAAGDAGAALGAALWLTVRRGGRGQRHVMHHAYLGPSYEEEALGAALAQAGLTGTRLEPGELAERVARELSHGRLVFWFQGRMEWGPRALGNRSLLADPRREDIRELINTNVKFREPFRPFAPSVLEERAAEYFEMETPSPFMQWTVRVRPVMKGVLPAVTHVDGTARVQTVDRVSNPPFRRLLEAFDRLTGVPVLLNTSFNVQEPIVCTPDDAIGCFLKTKVDWLVLGPYLVSRPVMPSS